MPNQNEGNTPFTIKRSLTEDIRLLRKNVMETANQVSPETEEALSYWTLAFEIPDLLVVRRPDHTKRFHRSGVLLLHSWEAVQNLDLARLLACSFHYAPATALLRVSYELFVNGGLLYLLANPEYHARSKVIDREITVKSEGVKIRVTLRKILNHIREKVPETLRETADVSPGILDLVVPFQEDPALYALLPGVKRALEELHREKLLLPISVGDAYSHYQRLSRATHGVMSSTQLGLSLSDGRGLFSENRFSQTGMKDFVEDFLKTLDLGLVVTFNVLRLGLPVDVLENSLEKLQNGVGRSYLPWFTQLAAE